MPDDEGKLTPEEATKAVQWVAERTKRYGQDSYQCPVCGVSTWAVADHLANIGIFWRGSALVVGAASYPQIQLICKHCGNTQFINAVLAGVVTPPTPPSETKEAGNG